MPANFPATLDDNSSLHQVSDAVTPLQAAHHNNLKDAIVAIEAKLGTTNTAVATSIDYRLGHPTGGHDHSGASGMGRQIGWTSLQGTPSYSQYGLIMPPIATTSLPTTLSSVGQVFYDSASKAARMWTGATWRTLAFV